MGASSGATPTVVIAEDNELWEVGVDFASALRCRGLRTVRLLRTAKEDLSRRQRLTNALCDLTVQDAYRPGGLSEGAIAQFERSRVVDVQCGEEVLELVHRATGGRCKPPVSELSLAAAVDKVTVRQFLADRGVPTLPTAGSAEDLGPNVHGPFMVKSRAGAGGQGAQKCEDLESVREAFRSGPPGTLIVQPFLTGEVLDSAGVARDGKVIQAATYRNVPNPRSPYGAAQAIIIADLPDVMELTHDVVRVMGISGPFAVDAVRDADGDLRVLDVNLRIFGCWTALQEAGLDVLGSYLYAIGQGPDPGWVELQPGGRFELIRFDEGVAARGVGPARWLGRHLALVARRRSYLGSRWAALTAARVSVQGAKSAVGAVRR